MGAVKKKLRRGKTSIVVDGVELFVEQVGDLVHVKKVIGRNRKSKLDVTSGYTIRFVDFDVIYLMKKLKSAAALPTAPCKCDYRYGYSDHAEHCTSIYVASDPARGYEDD